MKKTALSLIVVLLCVASCTSGPKSELVSANWQTESNLEDCRSVRFELFTLPTDFTGAIQGDYRSTWKTEWPKLGAKEAAKGFSDHGDNRIRGLTEGATDLTISVIVDELNNGDGKQYFMGFNPEAFMKCTVTITNPRNETLGNFKVTTRCVSGPRDAFPTLSYHLGETVKGICQSKRR